MNRFEHNIHVHVHMNQFEHTNMYMNRFEHTNMYMNMNLYTDDPNIGMNIGECTYLYADTHTYKPMQRQSYRLRSWRQSEQRRCCTQKLPIYKQKMLHLRNGKHPSKLRPRAPTPTSR